MRTCHKPNRSRLIKAAMQHIPCDLTIANVQFVNMLTGEIYPASVDILDGRVVRVREEGEATALPSTAQYDGKGAYLLPGFIDAHMHVESTMLLPEELSRMVVPLGTTTVCTDPHEIGNVLGIEGVRFMLENAKSSSLRQYVLAPSCVPSMPEFETTGAVFGAKEVGQLLDMPEVIGIAELMDFSGVYNDDHRMHSIIDEGIRRGAYLQGHAPAVLGKELTAYRLGGPASDHESYTANDVRQKLRNGIHINLRAGSIINTLTELLPGLEGQAWHDLVSVCTDDKSAQDILQNGHMNNVVRQAIKAGSPPLEAYKWATINAAREYGFDDLGAVAPGRWADIQLVQKMDGRRPSAVFIQGQLVAEDGRYLPKDPPAKQAPLPPTVNLPQITCPNDFRLMAPEGSGNEVWVNVIQQNVNKWHVNGLEKRLLPVVDGAISIKGQDNLCFVCIANRYGNGNKTIALYENFGLVDGAYASTVSHDSHNLLVLYKTPQDAFAAFEKIREEGGGLCIAQGQAVQAFLPLPVAGLMSPLPGTALVEKLDELAVAYRRLRNDDLSFMKNTTLSLPCVPRYLPTDMGLVNGIQQRFEALFPTG